MLPTEIEVEKIKPPLAGDDRPTGLRSKGYYYVFFIQFLLLLLLCGVTIFVVPKLS